MIYVMLENKEVLEGSEICLMDIDPMRLLLLIRLGEKLSRRANVKMRFTWITDPREALEGAMFIMPGYRIGGVKHMMFDFEIPMKYGICGGETAGPEARLWLNVLFHLLSTNVR
ncbi:MAG: hypothetical protein QXD69_05755 [Candidatus Bathyarchaeia archaeon]